MAVAIDSSNSNRKVLALWCLALVRSASGRHHGASPLNLDLFSSDSEEHRPWADVRSEVGYTQLNQRNLTQPSAFFPQPSANSSTRNGAYLLLHEGPNTAAISRV
jgi:hypothetical protein